MTKDPTYKWKVLFIVMIGTLMAALDTSIVNVSIPAIMADFGSSVDDVEWVLTGYMLAFATLMPLTPWLRDRLGHKLLYTSSLALFTIGSLLCGMSWSLNALIVARVIQAIGGGALTPIGMSMIADVFEPFERGKAMGYWGVGVVIGPAFGPTLGGYLTKHFGWPSIFLVNLPIGILGVYFTLKLLLNDKPKERVAAPFDFSGFAFLSVFMIFFLLGVSKGGTDGWLSPFIIWCWILATIGLVGFLLVESLIPDGIVDLRLFRFPVFTASMILSFTRSIVLFGGVFLLPLYLEQLKGLDELESGLILLPGSLVIATMMPVAGWLGDRVGSRYLSIVGLLGLGIFMYMYTDLTVDTSTWHIIFPTLLRGFGIALLMAPLMATALNSVPPKDASMASSMFNIVRQLGGSLGIAILATVFTQRVHHHLDHVGVVFNPAAVHFQQAVENVKERALSIGYSPQDAVAAARVAVARTAVVKASEKAYQDSFLVGFAIVVLTLIPAFWMPGEVILHHAGAETAME